MKAPTSAYSENRGGAPVLILPILWLCLFSLSLGSEPQKTGSRQSITPRKYDCSGGLKVQSEQGEKYVHQAVDDAIDTLKSCSPCRKMFDSEDEGYAINLLETIRKNNGILITSRVPDNWSFSSDYRKLKVTATGQFGDAAAMVIDLGRSTSGEMKLPCIYVNSTNFIVTGATAEDFALYGLEPRVQRSVAILHELAHAAGVIQEDGGEHESGPKSGANTDCVRHNCISCKEYKSCPGVLDSARKHRRKS